MKMKDLAIDQHNILVDLNQAQDDFEALFGAVQECVHQTAVNKGQWRGVKAKDVLLHVHSEVSELWREIEAETQESETISGFSKREEEAADIVLMIMSLSEQVLWRLGEAIVAKAKYNLKRER